MKQRAPLRNILKDWNVITDSDRIAAAKMYDLYGQVSRQCKYGDETSVQSALADFIDKSNECEQITAHPFIKYEKARILQMIDDSEMLAEKHDEQIDKNYLDAIFNIKMLSQYSPIEGTKSYASLLWIYGQFLVNHGELLKAIRYLEDSKTKFESIKKMDEQYYQCITLLATTYLNVYVTDRSKHIGYLRKARTINYLLQKNKTDLGSARKYASSLKIELKKYGTR